MVQLPSFTVGYLYNVVFAETQGWRVEHSRLKRVPVHVALSQNNAHPRCIRLSSNAKTTRTANAPKFASKATDCVDNPLGSQQVTATPTGSPNAPCIENDFVGRSLYCC